VTTTYGTYSWSSVTLIICYCKPNDEGGRNIFKVNTSTCPLGVPGSVTPLLTVSPIKEFDATI